MNRLAEDKLLKFIAVGHRIGRWNSKLSFCWAPFGIARFSPPGCATHKRPSLTRTTMPPVLCPNVLAEGFCSRPNCLYLHDALSCDACAMVFESPASLQSHMSSSKHRKRVAAPPLFGRCSICPHIVMNWGFPGLWDIHCRGRKHRSRAQTLKQDPATAEIISPAASIANVCDLCKVTVYDRDKINHQAGATHQRRVAFMRYNAAKSNAEADKNGIEIEGVGDFGVVDPSTARAGVQVTLTIQASSPKNATILLGCRLVSAQNRRKTACVLWLPLPHV